MEPIQMRVAARRALTGDIVEFTLEPVAGGALPRFTPGAHVTVKTPSGAMRRYSLIGDGESPETYRIAVKREPASRGGSASMHDEATEGTALLVEAPENEFELVEAPEYLLVAGGIGITPIYAMAEALDRRGKPFRLIYLTRSAGEAAYADELLRAFGDRLTLHHDEGREENFYDFWETFEKPTKAHVYCCGPAALMEEVEAVSGHWPEDAIHFEDFKPVEVVRADDRAFEVDLARSGRTITVPADRSILEALRDAGIATVSSCESGTCGTCRTRLMDGDADHRDMVLTEEDRERNIMICVSRAKAGRLVLDL
ncbi:MAG: PDR/VanB family oxidoreductase [Roseicyclus sp.]